jgi:hypothetical protein
VAFNDPNLYYKIPGIDLTLSSPVHKFDEKQRHTVAERNQRGKVTGNRKGARIPSQKGSQQAPNKRLKKQQIRTPKQMTYMIPYDNNVAKIAIIKNPLDFISISSFLQGAREYR